MKKIEWKKNEFLDDAQEEKRQTENFYAFSLSFSPCFIQIEKNNHFLAHIFPKNQTQCRIILI